MTGQKRPPISVEELIHKQKTEREPAEQGALSYMSSKKLIEEKEPIRGLLGRLRRGVSSSSTKMVLPIVVSVALAAVMLVQFAPSKLTVGALSTSLEALRGSLATTGEKLNYEAGRIDNIVGNLGTYASKTELAGYALAGQVPSISQLSEEVASITSELSILRTNLGSFIVRISNLETRYPIDYSEELKALEVELDLLRARIIILEK